MKNTLIPRTPSAYDSPLLIRSLLEAPVANSPEQEIVYRNRHRHTYRDLHERIHRLAGALTRLGVRPGDTVAVMDWDSHRYLECFFAIPMIGAVLHTVNVRLTPDQILYTINHAEDDVLLVQADFLPLVEAIKGRIETVKHYIVLQDGGEHPPTPITFAGEYEALLADAPSHFDFPDFDENTRATTFYTTGTTGLPKGVYFSHRQLVLHTFSAIASLASPAVQGRLHREDVYMPITPMFHVHAWGFPYIATTLGLKQVYPGRFAPENLLELIVRERVTFSHCVPTILHLLLKHPGGERYDLSRLKMIIGGAAMPQTLCLAALQRGIDLFTGYGMSETCPVLTLAHLQPQMIDRSPEQQAEIRCRAGLPVPLVHLRLVDEQMRDVPADGETPGEVIVRAPWLTQGYLKDGRNSEQLWRDGWLHTNDIAVRDEAGYIRITDRRKDVIKIAGEWVSSLALEEVLTHHPAVSEVAVIGAPDLKWGEHPLALVVLRPDYRGEPVTERVLVHHLRDCAAKGMVAKHAVVLKVRFVEAIDRTSVGKVNKMALRKKYLEPVPPRQP